LLGFSSPKWSISFAVADWPHKPCHQTLFAFCCSDALGIQTRLRRALSCHYKRVQPLTDARIPSCRRIRVRSLICVERLDSPVEAFQSTKAPIRLPIFLISLKMSAAASAALCGAGGTRVLSNTPRAGGRGSSNGYHRAAASRAAVPRATAATGAGPGPAPRRERAVVARELTQHTKSEDRLGDSTRCQATPGLGASEGGGAGPGARAAATTAQSTVATAATATATHTHVTTSGGYVVQKQKFSVVQEPPTPVPLQKPRRDKMQLAPESVTLVNDVVRLWVTTDGRIHLRRFGPAKRRKGAQQKQSASPLIEQLVGAVRTSGISN
jgi:hypothetical protein